MCCADNDSTANSTFVLLARRFLRGPFRTSNTDDITRETILTGVDGDWKSAFGSLSRT